MNPLSFALFALQLAGGPVHVPPALGDPPPDAWLAEDKVKHMMMSTAVVGFAHGGSRMVMEARPALVAAAVSGVAAGIWKEWRDRRIGRSFSARDLVWDALGIGIGLALVTKAR